MTFHSLALIGCAHGVPSLVVFGWSFSLQLSNARAYLAARLVGAAVQSDRPPRPRKSCLNSMIDHEQRESSIQHSFLHRIEKTDEQGLTPRSQESI